jgi:hypothetical protein
MELSSWLMRKTSFLAVTGTHQITKTMPKIAAAAGVDF